MKYLTTAISAIAIMTAPLATAGTLVFEGEVEQEVLVADEAPMGGSNAAWIVPLIAIAVIGLAISSGGDDDDDEVRECREIAASVAVEPEPCQSPR